MNSIDLSSTHNDINDADVSKLCYSLVTKANIKTQSTTMEEEYEEEEEERTKISMSKESTTEKILSCFHLNGCVILDSSLCSSGAVDNTEELSPSNINFTNNRKLQVKIHLYETIMDLIHHIDVVYALSEEACQAARLIRKEEKSSQDKEAIGTTKHEKGGNNVENASSNLSSPLYKFDTLSYIPTIKEDPFRGNFDIGSTLNLLGGNTNNLTTNDSKDNLFSVESGPRKTRRSVDLNVNPGRHFGITRVARLGLGKKNIHFDPYNSKCHLAMAEFATCFGLTKIIQDYVDDENVAVVETGMSYTRGGGEGLEWHADGEKGEVTVIMTMDDLHVDQGGLGILLGSHIKLQRGRSSNEENENKNENEDKGQTGKGQEKQDADNVKVEDDAEADEEEEEEEEIDFDEQIAKFAATHKDNHEVNKIYYYRAWHPILFDARLLHCAYKSTSSKRRVILWWIYNTEN